MEIVDAACSYTELTPSGTGLRVIGFGIGGKIHRKQRLPGPSRVVEVESYRKAERYITVTGLPMPGSLDKWPHLVNVDAVIDDTVARLDGAKSNGSGETTTTEEGSDGRHPIDVWIAANGDRYEKDDDGRNVDDSKLPPKLMAILNNNPPAADRSKAFHHAVCWLHYDLKWSVRKIGDYIVGAPVVPDRFDDRLDREICRCLCNADREKAKAKAKEEAKASKPKADKSKPGRAKDNKAFVDAVNERFADFSTWLPQMFPGKTAGEGQSALGVVNSYHDDLINADPDDDTTA